MEPVTPAIDANPLSPAGAVLRFYWSVDSTIKPKLYILDTERGFDYAPKPVHVILYRSSHGHTGRPGTSAKNRAVCAQGNT